MVANPPVGLHAPVAEGMGTSVLAVAVDHDASTVWPGAPRRGRRPRCCRRTVLPHPGRADLRRHQPRARRPGAPSDPCARHTARSARAGGGPERRRPRLERRAVRVLELRDQLGLCRDDLVHLPALAARVQLRVGVGWRQQRRPGRSDCTSPTATGCWGHPDIILGRWGCGSAQCSAGAARRGTLRPDSPLPCGCHRDPRVQGGRPIAGAPRPCEDDGKRGMMSASAVATCRSRRGGALPLASPEGTAARSPASSSDDTAAGYIVRHDVLSSLIHEYERVAAWGTLPRGRVPNSPCPTAPPRRSGALGPSRRADNWSSRPRPIAHHPRAIRQLVRPATSPLLTGTIRILASYASVRSSVGLWPSAHAQDPPPPRLAHSCTATRAHVGKRGTARRVHELRARRA